MRIRARTRTERKRQILLFLEVETEKVRTFSATAVRIAKALDLSPSAHLRAMANEMVEDGKIISFDVPSQGVVPYRRHYMLHPGKRGKPRSPRKIALTHNGKPAGVMLLPGFTKND